MNKTFYSQELSNLRRQLRDAEDLLTQQRAATKTAYQLGFQDGLRAYAHWQNGVELVGTNGTTLKEALVKVKETWNYCAAWR